MIQIENKERCCGCTSCVSVCPHGAITMRADGLGFLYPEVDKDLCVDCGLCDKVCAFDENYDKSSNLPDPEDSKTYRNSHQTHKPYHIGHNPHINPYLLPDTRIPIRLPAS